MNEKWSKSVQIPGFVSQGGLADSPTHGLFSGNASGELCKRVNGR